MQMLPPIKSVLEDFHSEELVKIENDIDALQDLCTLIEEAIVEEPPISIREGGMIKEGFDETIDQLRAAKTEGQNLAGRAGRAGTGTHRDQKPQNQI